MNWVECLFKYKLTVYLITIAVCLLGLFSLFFIQIAPMPAVQDNHIFIILEYPGANAETVQTQVTNKVANALQGIPNLDSIIYGERLHWVSNYSILPGLEKTE